MSDTSPESIREATRQVLASKDYRLDFEENTMLPFWERLLAWLLETLGAIAELFSFLDGLPEFVRWAIIFGLLLLLIALGVHIIYSILSAIRPPTSKAKKPFELTKHRDDPNTLEQQARQVAATGQYVEAARLLLRASLLRLEAAFDRPFRQATTNREYLRKYRRLPVLDAVRQLVETIDRTWYGEEPCQPQDYELCQASHAAIVDMIRSRELTQSIPRRSSA